ncbi:MAG: V-type ATP synthase subunit C [Methanosphaera sp.]|jgi:V/A-type H+-transporting ATPase subunit C|uniref:V-type ATP synthase subunit C n=1 Tax=Methanosphaera TaxID=2316 RepID=UPI0023809867|nr:V-type ATP synthase subunit C [Candidatus Methanosphaera massiliense]MDD6286309.1 V-type ATP synthase subunit C [Methanobacteriaceae archaeon]MDE4077526.1 V-type ATP synthase subunit C [Candidatus Methanosphaera massiliense]
MEESITGLISSFGFSPESFIALLVVVLAVIGAVIVVITFRPLMEYYPYTYPNARVRAKIGKILNDKQITELADSESLDEVKNYLRGQKDYAKFIDKYPIEQALDANLAESYDLLARIAPKDLKPTFDLMLDQWDIKNIKSVLIAKEAKLNDEETRELLVPYGVLKDDQDKLIEADSVQDIIVALEGTPYAKLLEDALPAYNENKTLLTLESALDNYYYERLLAKSASQADDNTRMLHSYVGTKIDISNIKIILRAKADGLTYDQINPYVINSGYQLREWKLKEFMESEDMNSLLSSIESSEYGSIITDHIPEYNSTQSITVFDEALDSYERDMANNIFRKKPFGVGPIIGFMNKKETEIKNLKIIARSKRGPVLPGSEIKEMLL